MDPLTQQMLASGHELRETHISRVFLSRDFAYKVKKPVSLGFLDFSTLGQRQRACEAEVLLNRRMAPDVYLAALPVYRDDQGRHRFGSNQPGELVDWVVKMRRLPDEASALSRLRRGQLTTDDIVQLAARLAAFHQDCRSDATTARFGMPECIVANVAENFEQTRASAPAHISQRDFEQLEAYQMAILTSRAALFEARARDGFVRDGHGDLRLEHVYFGEPGQLSVIDCIEFNDRFRYADVCADIAFLSMDLAWHDRVDLAERLLAEYARCACDYGLYPLIDFYQSYRAHVRAKVVSFLEDDASVSVIAKQRAHADATKYYRLAQASARPTMERPVVYVVGGMIASGKSTIADALAARLCCPVVDADRTRKHLAGVSPDTPLRDAAFSGPYSAAASERVYAALLERADQVLQSGRSVIIEATFGTRAHRRTVVEMAEGWRLPWLFIECRVSDAVTRARLLDRETVPGISDGRLEILDALSKAWEPTDELTSDSHLVLDTTAASSSNIARILDATSP